VVHPPGRWALHRHDVPRRLSVQAKEAKTETRTPCIPTATSRASTVSISAPIHTQPRYSTCARGLREHLCSDAMPRQI